MLQVSLVAMERSWLSCGFRDLSFGLKKDDQIEKIVSTQPLWLDAKQTEPPARYSQGKLIQEDGEARFKASPRVPPLLMPPTSVNILRMIPLSQVSLVWQLS